MTKTVVVVPCFNEEKRLDRASFVTALRGADDLHISFVDDGSRDGTRALLESLVADLDDGRADLLVLDENVGKAEAVRLGIPYVGVELVPESFAIARARIRHALDGGEVMGQTSSLFASDSIESETPT